jgi:hypothetical protein
LLASASAALLSTIIPTPDIFYFLKSEYPLCGPFWCSGLWRVLLFIDVLIVFAVWYIKLFLTGK